MSFFIFHPPKLSKKACPHYGDRLAADAKYGSTSMNLSFHALVCRLVTQAHFIFATLGQVGAVDKPYPIFKLRDKIEEKTGWEGYADTDRS